MTAVEKIDWFCPKCNSYVSSESVTFEETHQICNTGVILKELNQNKMTAVEWLESEMLEHYSPFENKILYEAIHKAKEIEKEQRGYSEEDVRLAYFQGEKDSYIKGGQTKEMENEFIQSLKQKHELNKLDILLCEEFIQDPTTTYSKCMCGRYFWEHPTKKK